MLNQQVNTEQILKFTRSTLAAYVEGNRNEAINLLRANGVSIPDDIDARSLYMALVKAMKDNIGFRRALKVQLHGLVSGTVATQASQGYSNYTEDYMGADSTVGSGAATTTTTPQTGSYLSRVFSADTISNILNTGLNILSGTVNNKSAQAGDAAALNEDANKAEQLKLAAAQTQGAQLAKSKIWTSIILVGVLAGLGYIGWRMLHKHKAK